MKLNNYKQLDNLCFSDFDVYKITINETVKIFRIDIEGVWLITLNGDRELGAGYIIIKSYKKINATYSNFVEKEEGKADINKVLEIKEINDHEVTDNSLKFSGFANDGSWMECEIIGGVVEAVFKS